MLSLCLSLSLTLSAEPQEQTLIYTCSGVCGVYVNSSNMDEGSSS